MGGPVTDSAILVQLEADDGKSVPFTDSAIIAQLEGKPAKEEKGILGKIDDYVRAAPNGITP